MRQIGDPEDSGPDYLRRRSRAALAFQTVPPLGAVLIVTGSGTLAAACTGVLRVLFGYDLHVQTRSTLGAALDAMLADKPGLLLLGVTDGAGPASPINLAIIRRFGYGGPILVLADDVGLAQRHELLAAGAADVIDRDEIEAARLAEALVACWPPQAAAAE